MYSNKKKMIMKNAFVCVKNKYSNTFSRSYFISKFSESLITSRTLKNKFNTPWSRNMIKVKGDNGA